MPPQIDHGRLLGVLGVVSLFVLAYGILTQQALFGAFVVAAIAVVYLFFVFVQVLDRIASALETIAGEDGGE